jgi:F420H(2)-dependent quinone reductase
MSFEKTPSGTRGSRAPSRSNAFTRFIGRMMIKSHRRNGDRFMGMDVLYLTTVGAKTGQKRQTPLAAFQTVTAAGWSSHRWAGQRATPAGITTSRRIPIRSGSRWPVISSG